jgi:plasmid stabilization system protein ParE
MKRVFHRAALGDLDAIEDYIRRDSPAAARTVVRRISNATVRLAQFLFLGGAVLSRARANWWSRERRTSLSIGLSKNLRHDS